MNADNVAFPFACARCRTASDAKRRIEEMHQRPQARFTQIIGDERVFHQAFHASHLTGTREVFKASHCAG